MPLVPTAPGHNATLTLMAPDGSYVAGQADATGKLITTGSGGGGGGGTVDQGIAAADNAPWPVKLSDGTQAIGTTAHPVQVALTDGTHAQPMGDAQARAVQVSPGDGTNATPAGDVAARARFSKTTDGTNTAAVKAASTAAVATDPALVVALSPNGAAVKVTDGANFQPTGDTQGRAIQVTIGDGTNPTIAAAAAAADAKANPTAGLLQSIMSGFNGATWDRIRTGLVGVQTTFVGVLNTIGMARYNATPPTLADGNIAPLQSNTTGALRVVSPDQQTAVLDMSATPSAVAVTTTVSATITGLSKATAVTIIAKNQGITGGTLDLTLQDSPDGGTTWFDFWHLPQLAAGASSNVLAYNPGINDSVTAIGQGTAATPGVVLAAGSKRGGHPFDAMRLVMTTGPGVSANALQTVKAYVTQPTP